MEDFKTIKVKFNEQSESSHTLFYKKLKSTASVEKNELRERALFVTGIPPYLGSKEVRTIFSCFGKIDHVLIYAEARAEPFDGISNLASESLFREDESKLDCFKVAYVLYTHTQSLDKALQKSNEKIKIASTKEATVVTGLKKWIEEYKANFVDAKILKKEIEDYMQTYDEFKAKKEEEEKEKTNEPDEEGWITVTNKSRKANLAMTERNIQKLKFKQKKRQQKMQMVNFYNFQAKDSKKEYIDNLRKKFEEDKKRIEEMKVNRKFKPF